MKIYMKVNSYRQAGDGMDERKHKTRTGTGTGRGEFKYKIR